MTDPLLVSIADAARMLNISTARARRMVATNSMPGLVRLGGTRSQRVSIRILEAWIEQEAAAATAAQGAAKQVPQPSLAHGDAEGAASTP